MTHPVQSSEAHTSPPASTGAADLLLTRSPILANAYFTGLRDGTLDKETFIRTQRQFFHAVRFFSRPMAALMSRLPDSASRRTLMHNLAEEHGLDDEGPGGFHPAMAHDQTFIAFLSALGVHPAAVASSTQGPAVRAFNLALLGACFSEPLPLAFACLGIIEYTFADISALIGAAVVERGWILPAQLVHYKLHAELDKRHAADFFLAAELACPGDEASSQGINDGLALGLQLFDRLYTDLLAEQ